ncbi:MAG: BMP family ABC transporter substrate-binding protein [Micropruina glycogenica]
MKKSLIAPVALGAFALVVGGCATPPAASSSAAPSSASASASAPMSDFKACMVSDAGGFDDKSFNETAYKGLTTTPSRSWALKAQVRSSVAADYAKNVQQMVDQKCNIIVTVGFALARCHWSCGEAESTSISRSWTRPGRT